MPKSHTQRVGSVIANASGDDWAGPQHTGTFNSTDTRHYLGNTAGTATKVGFLFRGLLVPQGATIEAASLQLVATGANAGAPVLTIKGVAADAPTAPTTLAESNALSRTTASVTWTNPTSASDGSVLDSPDITTVIQEIVNRAGFTGAALVVFVEGDSTSGAYRRIYTANASNPLYVPRLTITWTDAANVHTVDAPYTWTVPAGWSYAQVECWGAGGIGGAASHASARAGGGGGGAYASSIVAVTAGNTKTIVAGHGSYSTGFDDAYGRSYYVDQTTIMAEYGRPADTVSTGTAGTGAAGGAASTSVGDTKKDGGAGGDGQAGTGGGGGGSATSSAAGSAASGATGGAGEATGATATSGQGAAGTVPGSGGAGSSNGFLGGGAGGHGRVRLTKSTGGGGVSMSLLLSGG